MPLDYVSLRRAAAQAIPLQTWTPITWDTEVEDASGYWTITAATRITVPAGKGGKFVATFNIEYSTSTVNRSMISLYHYNSADVLQLEYRRPTVYNFHRGTNTHELTMAAGDYIIAQAWRDAVHTAVSWFEMIRLSA